MIIAGSDLRDFILKNNICSINLYDETSIKIRLGNKIFRAGLFGKEKHKIVWGDQETVDAGYQQEFIDSFGLTLNPGDCVLASSEDTYVIPTNLMGFVQTKGTLARLFVFSNCADGQIDAGYHGKITLELINCSPFTIVLPATSNIAQLFLIKCSDRQVKPYSGRYSGALGPTKPLFNSID